MIVIGVALFVIGGVTFLAGMILLRVAGAECDRALRFLADSRAARQAAAHDRAAASRLLDKAQRIHRDTDVAIANWDTLRENT